MLIKIFSTVSKKAKKTQLGVTAIEYAIIGVAISAVVLAIFSNNGTLRTALNGAMTNITSNIASANQQQQ